MYVLTKVTRNASTSTKTHSTTVKTQSTAVGNSKYKSVRSQNSNLYANNVSKWCYNQTETLLSHISPQKWPRNVSKSIKPRILDPVSSTRPWAKTHSRKATGSEIHLLQLEKHFLCVCFNIPESFKAVWHLEATWLRQTWQKWPRMLYRGTRLRHTPEDYWSRHMTIPAWEILPVCVLQRSWKFQSALASTS